VVGGPAFGLLAASLGWSVWTKGDIQHAPDQTSACVRSSFWWMVEYGTSESSAAQDIKNQGLGLYFCTIKLEIRSSLQRPSASILITSGASLRRTVVITRCQDGGAILAAFR
jgi:hypothetical protein